MLKEKMIGAKHLTNNHALIVWELNEWGETISVSLNNNPNKARTYKLYQTNRGTYFNWHGTRQYLDEFMRV